MSSQKKFVVQYPPQYGVVKSKLDGQFESTLFPNVYKGCQQSVLNIIRHNGGDKEESNKEESNSGKSLSNDEKSSESTSELFVNPIIAITGSRGSGKSSAMQSFAKYLGETKLSGCSFSVLPAIDATQFGKNESVIGNITASMYREYSNHNDHLSVDKKRDFVRLAKEVNNTAVMYSTGEWFKCGDDLLQDSEKVGNLRQRLHDLIMNYLNLYSDNSLDKKKYLVIMLDDLDMCSEGAFTIIEEIRKFLCIRNVIILMTMQSTQLRTVLQASYTTAFGKVDKETEPKIRNVSMELAFRSYEKLFPASRCHAMPIWSADQLKDCDLFIEEIDGKDKIIAPNDPYAHLPEDTRSNILYRTLHMIWRKTLLIPVCSQDGEHLLVPNNLRSLHNFIAMFSGMDDAIDNTFVDRCPKDKPYAFIPGLKDFDNFFNAKPVITQVLEKNLTVFENYLLDNLSTYGESLNHNEDNQKLAETLQNLILEMHTVSLEHLNAKIVGDILESKLPEYVEKAFQNIKYDVKTENGDLISNVDLMKAKQESEEKASKENDEREILKEAVSYADSISMGDVLYVLGKISVKTRCRYIAYLIEVIRTMWSIRMTREFYVNSKKDDSSLEVSLAFRRTVGGLMVDANTTAFTSVSTTNDWHLLENNTKHYDEFFFATSIDDGRSSVLDDNNLANACLKYRDRNSTGKPYYDKDGGYKNPVCHPLAYYTNALRPLKYYIDKLQYEAKVILYFPFYSLDFMYRFYEEFRKVCRPKFLKKDKCPYLGIFLTLDSCKIDAMGEVLTTVSKYIPLNLDTKKTYKDTQNNAFEKLYNSLTYEFKSADLTNLSQKQQIDEYIAFAILLKDLSKHVNNDAPLSSAGADRQQSSNWEEIISELESKKKQTEAEGISSDPQNVSEEPPKKDEALGDNPSSED